MGVNCAVVSQAYPMSLKIQLDIWWLHLHYYTVNRFGRMHCSNCSHSEFCSLGHLHLYSEPPKLLAHSTILIFVVSNNVWEYFVDKFVFRWDKVTEILRKWNQSTRFVDRYSTITDSQQLFKKSSADVSLSNATLMLIVSWSFFT